MKKTLIGFLVLCFGISLLSSAQTAEAEMVQSNDDPYTYYEDMDFVQVSLGGSHSSAITSEGRIFTWGSNNYGQLGDGTTTRRYTPTDITGYFGLNSGETIVSVSLGLSHSTAITSEGRIFTWGRNQYGQLGDGSTTNRNTPTDITGQLDFNTGESITGVSLGAVHSSVVSSAGRLFTWGQNDYGQLGNGTTTYGSIPTDITGQFSLIAGETLTSVSLGSYHSSAITSGGRLFIWGQNSYGQLGNGTGTTLTTPTDITGHFNLIAGETITRVSLGFSHSSAITSEGRLFTWGFNNYGQLGDGTTTYKLNPTDIMGRFSLGSDETIVSISLGHSHSIAITSEGRLFTWGWNQYGQVGDGTTTDRYTPTEITSQFISYTGETITGVSLAGSLSSAITSEGRLFIWGQNDYGQLGDGTTSSSSVPKHIVSERLNILQSLLPVTEEIAKYNNSSPSAVLMTSGRLFTAGHNQYGNLGDGTTINTKHYVEITDNFHLGENEYIIDITSSNNGVLTSNGRIFTWGRNNEGQLGTGSKDFEPHPNPIDITSNFNLHDGESVVSLKSTSNTFGALTSEGRLFVWGNYCNETLFFFPTEINFQTELGEEERIKDFELTYVNWGLITSTGRVFTWGVNDRGQLGDGTVIDKTTPTEITDNFSLLPNEYVEQLFLSGSTSSAITSEGRIFTWGSNNYGQLGDGTTTNRTTPTEITNQFDLSEDDIIVQMNMGNSYSSALSLMGEVFTWGLNYYGELGNGTYSNWNPNPNPINITSNFDLYETDNITIISGGSRPSGAVSSRGILYGWGYNGDGRLLDGTTQDRYIPHPINQIIDTSNAILKTDVGESVNHLSDHIKVSIFPKYDIGNEIKSIMINGVSYDTTDFDVSHGRIEILITNTGTLGDVLTFSVQSLTFVNDETILPTGDLTAATTLVSDTFNPNIVFDYEYEIFIEQRLGDDSLILATGEDDTGEVVDVTITGTVDWATPGEYTLTYTATDLSGNTATRDRIVYVMPDVSTSGTAYNGYTFYYFDDEEYSTSTDLTNQIIRYNNQNYSSSTDYSAYEYLNGINELLYEFEIGDRLFIVSKTVDFADVIPPSYDEIVDVTMEAQLDDIDWTYLITNPSDNSGGELTFEETEDLVDESTPGTYQVTVRVYDEAGNFHQQIFYVTIEDTTAPSFDPIDDQTIEAGTADMDWATFIVNQSDNSNGSLTAIEVTDTVDYDTPGTYSVTVKLADASGNETSQEFHVTVEDTTAPTVELLPSLSTIYLGEEFVDSGVTVVDLSSTSTNTDGTVDINTVGTYTIVYTVEDEFGNATTVTRVVHVVDPVPSVVFTLSNAKTTLEVGETYTDGECEAVIGDATYTCGIKENNVDTTTPGVYTVIYTVLHNDVEYTYTRYVFVYDGNTPLTFHYDLPRKEGDWA